jgi:HEAT repeat protein
MKIVAVALTLLFLAGIALAGDPAKPSEVEKAWFRAYYLENGKRDFEAARKAFEEIVRGGAGDAERLVTARIGVLRCALKLGEIPTGEQVEEVAAEVARLPADVRAEVAKEWDDLKARLDPDAESGEARGRIISLLAELVRHGGPDTEMGAEAVENLLLFGERAIPVLDEALREPNPHAVAGAARVLTRLGTERATEKLRSAMDDARVMFPALIVTQVGTSVQKPHLALLFAACERPHGEIRKAATEALERMLIEGISGTPAMHVEFAAATLRKNPTREDLDRAVRSIQNAMGRTPASFDPETMETILALTKHADPAVRKAAVALACRDPRLAPTVLLTAIVDESESVRDGAAKGFGSGMPPAVRFPADRSTSEMLVRAAAYAVRNDAVLINYSRVLTDLGRIAKESDAWDALPPLVAAIVGLDDEDRREEAWSRLTAVIAPIRRPVESPDERVSEAAFTGYRMLATDPWRAEWMRLFRDRFGEEIEPVALAALEGDSAELRLAAIRVLERRLEPAQQVEAFARLRDDPDAAVRLAVFDVLIKQVVDGDERRRLAESALNDPSTAVRERAIRPLVEADGEGTAPALVQAVVADPRLCLTATRAMAATGADRAAREFLSKVLGQVDRERWPTLRLDMLSNHLTSEFALILLESSNIREFNLGAQVAGERKLFDALPLLLQSKFSDYPTAVTCRKQIEAYYLGMRQYNELKRDFGEGEGSSAFEKAVELTRSPEAAHRRAAAYAFGAIGNTAAIGRLLDLATDADVAVADAALTALERLGGPKPGEE